MRRPGIQNNITVILLLFGLTCCTGLKRLPPGEKLYTGAEIELLYPGKLKHTKEIKAIARSAAKPQPNQQFLGMRPKLWLFQVADKVKKEKLRQKLKGQGEQPVLSTMVKPAETARYIDARLFNAGIFNAVTSYRIVESKKKFRVIYTCRVHIPYKINALQYVINDQKIDSIFRANQKKTVLTRGNDYKLDDLQKERERLDGLLKDNGYFYFHPDYLLFKADTESAGKKVNLKLTLKSDIPAKALTRYRIENIFINPDFSLANGGSRDTLKADRLEVDSVVFLKSDTKVKPGIILQNVSLKKHDFYSRKKHNSTLNRLMTVGSYKFVRIKFVPADTVVSNTLNMRIFLTPMPKRTLRSEANLISKSNDFMGPQLNFSYINRNAFNGAELLKTDFGGSFETQISGKYKNLYSYTLNSKVEIIFPRFVVPFPLNNPNNYFVQKTKLSLGYNYLKRIAYFDLRSLQFTYGFKWKESALKEHELNPVNINVVSVVNRTPAFNDLLASNPFIQKSYNEQFIAGAWYSFLYTEQVLPAKKNQIYFNLVAETSGNAFSLIANLAGRKVTDDHPQKVAGLIYSQFAKVGGDFRNYVNFKHSKFVTRAFVGVGKAYGNSSTIPYIKQFFSGGANSIRAFAINSVGPGTHTVQSNIPALFLQQGGDIKLEGNIEYRFDIFRSLKGAVFTDAGNVWLFKTNPAVNDDAFSFNRFYNELAVGAGLGLRLDITFFVLRFDLATPLRKPWLPLGERWVIQRPRLADPHWRSDNLVLNVAIGYPF